MKKNTSFLLILLLILSSCKKPIKEINKILKTKYFEEGSAYFNSVEKIINIDEAAIPLLKTEVTYFYDTERKYSKILGSSGGRNYYQHCVRFHCKGFGNGDCISMISGEAYEWVDIPLNSKEACFQLIEQISILKGNE